MREGGLDGLLYLQYTNFLNLRDKELVIASPVITAHTLRKKRERLKQCHSSQDSLALWSLDVA